MQKRLLLCALIFASSSALSAEMVTTQNFVRAESDMQMNAYIKNLGAFGKLVHSRKMYDVTKQLTIRPNTDTLYSFGIFDLTQPLTLEMPKTSRYQSAMVISEDHSSYAEYEGKHTITQKEVGTRYAFILIRTFVDPNDKSDLEKAHATQDKIKYSQKSKGKFEIPDWDAKSLKIKREELVKIAELLPNTEGMFGIKNDLNPVIHLVGAAYGWAGLTEKDAFYDLSAPKQNNGKVVHTLNVKDVPVDGFWSVTVYNKDGYFDINQRGVYSLNNKTSVRDEDGSVTIQFGDCKGVDNCLDIMDDWNYAIRMYRPQESILNGTWKFPKPTPK